MILLELDLDTCKEMVARALNTWTDAPKEVHDLYDKLFRIPERYDARELKDV